MGANPGPLRLVVPLLCATAIAAGATTADSPQGPGDTEIISALDARLEVVGRTQGLLEDKFQQRSKETSERVRALYKMARAGWAPLWVDVDERRAAAVRRAAARRILRRDVDELDLLRDELAAAAAARTRLSAERQQADVNRPARGSLARPVSGVVLTRFGPYRDRDSGTDQVRRGVEMRSRTNGEVRAVAAGTVRYAGPVRGLGTAVVLAHDGFLSVVGQLATTSLVVGDLVDQGAVIGVAAGRRIYVEIRLVVGDSGYPVDPSPLFQ